MAGVRTFGPKRALGNMLQQRWAQPFPRTGGVLYAEAKSNAFKRRCKARRPRPVTTLLLLRERLGNRRRHSHITLSVSFAERAKIGFMREHGRPCDLDLRYVAGILFSENALFITTRLRICDCNKPLVQGRKSLPQCCRHPPQHV